MVYMLLILAETVPSHFRLFDKGQRCDLSLLITVLIDKKTVRKYDVAKNI